MPRALHPTVLRASLLIATFAWAAILAGVVFRVTGEERSVAFFIALAWPLVYGFCLGGCWVGALLIHAAHPSTLFGPLKGLQITFMRKVGLPWIHFVLVAMPSAVLIIGVLGLLGVLPIEPADTPQ